MTERRKGAALAASRDVRSRAAAVLLALLGLAPTAGDIGSCGQEAVDLDALKFFSQKGGIDLAKCDECGFTTGVCERLRRGEIDATEFPPGCFPLVHDGEVCLHALLAAGCDDYREFVADEGRTVPTECNFCPPRDAGSEAAP